MIQNQRVALVVDALPFQGGAEKVLESALELFPRAPIYTHIYNKRAFQGTIIEKQPVKLSFIDRLPFSHRHHRSYLPFYPLATEQFDLSSYDVILSFSYAVAHGILAHPEQLHVAYKFTVMRHAWHGYHDYLMNRRSKSAVSGWVARIILHYFRIWDAASASRVDQFLAASCWVARSIRQVYRREAQVVYPPVDVENFRPYPPRANYYLAVSRLEPHKRVDVLIDAFRRLGHPLLIVGDGSLRKRLERAAAPNVRLLGRVSQSELRKYLGRAKAFVHAAVEDFGISAVEAQAAGCPVIAYDKGGLKETILDGETGLFYKEQCADSLMQTVSNFERGCHRFNEASIRENALRFNRDIFMREYLSAVEAAQRSKFSNESG